MWTPFVTSLLLSLFSLVNLFGIKPNLFINQLIYLALGFSAFFLLRRLNWRLFRDNSKLFYWLFIFLLVVTYIIGFEAKGSKRWIDLYFFNFQPSELFKAFFIIYFANYFAKNRKHMDNLLVIFKSFLYFIVPTFIIFKQPDLGNALVYAFIFGVMLFFSRIPKKILIYFILILTISLPVFWVSLKDYQRTRVTSFINPQVDSAGSGYNLIQSIITVGSGKFTGRGLGYGTQSKLLFLPENHTDFAFSSLTEQFGFFGSLCVIFFYFILAIYLIKKIVKYSKQNDDEGFYKFLLTLGFLSYFIFHIFVNIGMNLGIFPVTGIVLPLLSYGGSAVMGYFIGLSILP